MQIATPGIKELSVTVTTTMSVNKTHITPGIHILDFAKFAQQQSLSNADTIRSTAACMEYRVPV